MSESLVQKIGIPVLTSGLVFIGAWVWNSHTNISSIGLKMEHSHESIVKLEAAVTKLNDNSNETKVAVLERDLEHVQTQLNEIRTLVLKNNSLLRQR